VLIPTTELRSDGTALVDFVITNVGTEPMSLPSSVNQNIEQQTSVLTLWLTSDAIKDEYFGDTGSSRPFKIEMSGPVQNCTVVVTILGLSFCLLE